MTAQDTLDAYDQEIADLQRALLRIDSTPMHLIEDEKQFVARRRLIEVQLEELRNMRAGAVANLIAEAEGFRP